MPICKIWLIYLLYKILPLNINAVKIFKAQIRKELKFLKNYAIIKTTNNWEMYLWGIIRLKLFTMGII
jgi:hypothetical protein